MKKIIHRFRIDSQIKIGYGTAFFLLLISHIITLYLLRKRSQELNAHFTSLHVIILISLLITFILVTFAFITYVKENKARRRADETVDVYQDRLEQQVEQLARANKELIQMRSIEKFASTGRIARTIAHEVRNPLTNINLAIEQIKADMRDEDNNLSILFDMVTRNSNRINQLITDLLNSTKFAELAHENVSVNTILSDALELAKDRISLNNIVVDKDYYINKLTIFADVDKLKIAFLNIIVNAIEAMEPGKGVLKLSSRLQNRKCLVTISDNGKGMDSESLGRLFEPYFTSKNKGTGLGLTNTQNIILNHQGSISVESEVNKGTSFVITLDAVE